MVISRIHHLVDPFLSDYVFDHARDPLGWPARLTLARCWLSYLPSPASASLSELLTQPLEDFYIRAPKFESLCSVAMAFGISRAFAAPLLLLNACLYIIVVCIAGWAFNKGVDTNWAIGNRVTPYVVGFALIAGVVGIASKLSGGHHLASWKTDSLAGSTAAAFIAWLLTLLAMGVVCKEIHVGHVGYKRLKVLEAFIIALSGTQLFYLLAVGAGSFAGEYGQREPYSGPPPTSKDSAAV